jgi:hypothetical protein
MFKVEIMFKNIISSYCKIYNKKHEMMHPPFGMLNPGRRNSPSPTPPFLLLASLTILAIRFLMYSMSFTSSSAGTFFDKAANALFAALTTSLFSSLNL